VMQREPLSLRGGWRSDTDKGAGVQERVDVPAQVVERDDEGATAFLLTPGERWGWQCADLSKLVLPFPYPEPQVATPALPDLASAARSIKAEQSRARPRITAIRWIGAIPFGIAVGLVLQGLLHLASMLTNSADTVVGFVAYASVAGWIWAWALVRRQRYGAPAVERRLAEIRSGFEHDWQEAHVVHGRVLANWQRQRDVFQEQQRRQLEQMPLWGAVQLLTKPRRIDVFGDASGWPALLATFGGSVLADGEELVVLDFSQRAVSKPLSYLGTRGGRSSRVTILPDEAESCDLLRGLTKSDIRDVLVEAFHADLEGATREQRALADRVLAEIVDVLEPNVTMGRIWRAVRAVTGQDPAPDTDDHEFQLTEWDSLSRMFGEDYRVRIGERLIALETQLYALRRIGAADRGSEVDSVDFRGFVVGGGTTVTDDVMADLLVQRCVRQLSHRDARGAPTTIIVAGADALTERMLARLDAQAERSGVRVVLMFRELREDRLESAGSGGAVGFFRLSNEAQARRAADWIGREHSFKTSQLTSSRGSTSGWSVSSTDNQSASVSWNNMNGGAYLGMAPSVGGDGLNISVGQAQTTGTSGGSSDQYSIAEQRVEEHVVEPNALRALADGCLLLVEFGSQTSGRRVVSADVSPLIARRSRALPGPLPPELARTAAAI
jgi:hypothetical protein